MNRVNDSYIAGQRVLARRSVSSRKASGQYLTPPRLARYAAQRIGSVRAGAHILDPAMGSGVLLCAVVERLLAEEFIGELYLTGFEVDPELAATARTSLEQLRQDAQQHGLRLFVSVFETDFVLNAMQHLRPSLFIEPIGASRFDHIIANPPYFKLHGEDERVKIAEGWIAGGTNIYTLFMGLSARLLNVGGRATFIVPRSFCSGTYFKHFRSDFLKLVNPVHIHLFERRGNAFKEDAVLQENLVFTFQRMEENETLPSVTITSSSTLETLVDNMPVQRVPMMQFVDEHGLFRLPTSARDQQLLSVMDAWPSHLETYGLAISTGPVVPFRAKDYLRDVESVLISQMAVPLLWMQHVRPGEVTWPLQNGFRKAEGITHSNDSSEGSTLVVPLKNYVLLRRFSAKEEPRRLIAAPLLADNFSQSVIGLENHLNYIYRPNGDLSPQEVIGLSALFNSGLVDRYFRIANGNTQVNAAELRALPLPGWFTIQAIGTVLRAEKDHPDPDAVVMQHLQQSGEIPDDWPIFRETRG